MSIDGSNLAAMNLSTLVPVDQPVHRCSLDVDCYFDPQVRGSSGMVQHRGFFPLGWTVTVLGASLCFLSLVSRHLVVSPYAFPLEQGTL